MLLLGALCLGCGVPHGVIPRDDLAQIYAKMFMADQHIQSQSELRRMADTMRVYESIFKEYGYSSKDFNRSMEYYIEHPKRHIKALKKAQGILEDEKNDLIRRRDRIEEEKFALRAQKEARAKRLASFGRFAPKRMYLLDSIRLDSLGGGFLRDTLGVDAFRIYHYTMETDTLFFGPRAVPADSVWNAASVAGQEDPLAEAICLETTR